MERQIDRFPDEAITRVPQNHQVAARIIGLALGQIEELLATPYDVEEAAYVNHRLEILLSWIPYMQVAHMAAAPQRERS